MTWKHSWMYRWSRSISVVFPMLPRCQLAHGFAALCSGNHDRLSVCSVNRNSRGDFRSMVNNDVAPLLWRNPVLFWVRHWNKKLNSRWDTWTWHRSILLPLLSLTPPTERFPWNDLRKILHGGQRIVKVQNGEEILPTVSTPEWGARTLQTTDGFAIAKTRT